MNNETTYSGVLGELTRFTGAVTANAADLPHLDGPRGRLEKILSEAQQVAQQQAALTASKQESSKRLKALVVEGQRLASGLRKFLKEHYGTRSEKLAEFGLQPLRSRAPKATPATQEPPPPAPTPSTTPPPPAAHPAANVNPKP
ncbi:MAG TPA: hypothetical protein VFC23_11355 [Thermoanaerobaculia bacterium]|nr:hypothetical protein [Thermoanaerobaculia bacterium]